MDGAEELQRKRYLSLKESTQKWIDSKQESLRFIGDPHYLNWFSVLRQGLFCYWGVEYREYSPSVRTGRNSSIIWRNVSPSRLRGRIGKSLLGVPRLRIGRTLERLVRQQKVPETLKFIISFPMSRLFVIIETRRVWASFCDLNLL